MEHIEQPERWPQRAEQYLRRSEVPEELWADLWSKVEYLVELRNNPPQGSPFLTLPVAVPIKTRTASKMARFFSRLAAHNRRHGDESRARNCETYASHLSQAARQRKRHEVEPETCYLLGLMCDIHAMTGHWHDPELAGMMRCAGYPPNLSTASVFRTLRARNAEYMRWLQGSPEITKAQL